MTVVNKLDLKKFDIMYKILITGSIHQIGLEILRKEKDIEIHYAPDLAFDEIFKIIAPFHCILSRSETQVTRELIDEAPNLKVIARAAVGIGNIDVNHATVIRNSCHQYTWQKLKFCCRTYYRAASHCN